MSLDLLKERFGHSVKKEADNKEKINEKLSKAFNFDLKVQHQEELEEKDNIIENLRQELRDQKLENKLAMNTKKIYEDKIKTMNYVDSTELIPLLTTISRKKQGFRKLTWESWIQIPENTYLFQINENVARQIFENTNNSISAEVSNINLPTQRANLIEAGRTSRTRGGDEPATAVDTDYVLTFTGDTAVDSREDYVSTLFNPDSYDGAGTGLNRGFTVSYWVKPLELTGDVFFAFGKRSQTDGRFEFGVKNQNKIKVGIGAADKDDNDESSLFEVDTWYNFVVTYGGDDGGGIGGDRHVRVYLNGTELLKTGASGGGMGIANWIPGKQNCDEGCDDAANAASYLYFGGRSWKADLVNPYNQGWACSLSEVAIYNVEKDEDGTFANEVYNAGWGYNHEGNSGLVGYWKFNEGSGNNVTDYGPYEKHGTLTSDAENGSGTPTWEKNTEY